VRVAVLVLAVVTAAGCAGSPSALPSCASASGSCATPGPTSPAGASSSDPIGLGVVNATDLRLTLFVNSTVIETLSPHTADVAIHMSALPPLPWVVQVRTSSGRVLSAMTAGPGDIPGPPALGLVVSGKEAAADLSCGQLYLWTGAFEPSWPAPGSGSPGDCMP
jgi:hypothetical protein